VGGKPLEAEQSPPQPQRRPASALRGRQSFLIVHTVFEMSFGYSVGDFVLLVQVAHRTVRNCQKAGEEYKEIACEMRSLHSVLRTLRSEAQKFDSNVFRQDQAFTRELIETTDGCKNVLDALGLVLAKYEGLKVDSEAGTGKKLWQKLRFGSKTQELSSIRGKLINYTSTISVFLDTMQIKAAHRMESKIDDGFSDIKGEFGRMRKEVFKVGLSSTPQGTKWIQPIPPFLLDLQWERQGGVGPFAES